jgi:hypothetical protein
MSMGLFLDDQFFIDDSGLSTKKYKFCVQIILTQLCRIFAREF